MASAKTSELAAFLADGRPWSCVARDPGETRAVACTLAQKLENGAVVALCGNLGSGKTCFAQGLAAGLGLRQSVTSPTFALVREYGDGPRTLVHIDLYRLANGADIETLGLDDCLHPEGLAAFEWADRFPDLFPENTCWVHLAPLDDPNERRIEIRRQGKMP
jgi:tRNA threonylcarbamoyladenosine biosynthesis protein TsaE